MTIATEFHNWSDHPSADAHRLKDGSPALKRIRDHHLARWGGKSLSVPSLFQPRPIVGGSKPSAHAGCAVDIRWQDPGPGREVLEREILPFYIGNSQELHVQAIHDYVGSRVWRAHRSHDANGGWKPQKPGSHGGKMGDPSAQFLHIEVNRTGWHDDRPVEEMLNGHVTRIVEVNGASLAGFPPTDLRNGVFGLFPLNPTKPHIRSGDHGDLVLYAQAVIFHKAGGGIDMDSDFGQQTVGRISDLQRLFAMHVHGEVDATTWGAIDFLATH